MLKIIWSPLDPVEKGALCVAMVLGTLFQAAMIHAYWHGFEHFFGLIISNLLLITAEFMAAGTVWLLILLSADGTKAALAHIGETRKRLRETRLSVPPLPQLVEPLTLEEMPLHDRLP